MASEIKVNKISPESGTTLTLGDSGDTINFGSGVLPNFENLTVTGDLTVDTNSLKVDSTNNFVGIGTASPSVALDVVGAITASGNITGTLATAAQPNITSVGTLTSFTSTGIDDNATSTAITIDSSENVGIGTTSMLAPLVVSNGGASGFEFHPEIATNTNRIVAYNRSSNAYNIFKLDALQYAFNVSGSEKITIDSSGNLIVSNTKIGIGTSNPIADLSIVDSTTSSGVEIQPEITTDTNRLINYDRGDNSYKNFRLDALTQQFLISGSEKMRIDSSGNVLIGTTDAGYPVFGDNLTLEGSTHSGITIRSGTSSQGNLYFSDATGTGAGTYAGAINYLHSVDAMTFLSNSGERMRITSSGNVGIGTSSPAHNLEIVATNSGSINDTLQIRNNTTTTGSGSRLRFITSTDLNSDANGASIASVRNGNDNDLVFEVENSEAMRIDHAGNVGIDTTSPTQKLDVNGTVKATAFQGDGSALTGVGGASDGFQAITTGSGTSASSGTLVVNDELFDDGSNYSTSNGRYTAPSTGFYHFTAGALQDGSAGGYFYFTKNGSAVGSQFRWSYNGAGNQTHMTMSMTIDLSAGDYVNIYSSQSVYINQYLTFGGFKIY